MRNRKYIIQEIRTDLKINQQKVADAISINRTYLSAIENNIYEPSVDILIKIARALSSLSGTSINYTDLYKEEL